MRTTTELLTTIVPEGVTSGLELAHYAGALLAGALSQNKEAQYTAILGLHWYLGEWSVARTGDLVPWRDEPLAQLIMETIQLYSMRRKGNKHPPKKILDQAAVVADLGRKYKLLMEAAPELL